MYDRKIIYLHRYEGEMDKGNVGYIKQENHNGTCSFTISIMNMPPNYKADASVVIMPENYSLCKIHIKDGEGQGMAILEERQLLENGICYEKINQYEICIGEMTFIRGRIVPPKKPREEVKPIERSEMDNVPEEKMEMEEKVEAAWIAKENYQEPVYQKPREPYKSKWEQLSSGRKKVNLMGKESEYIQITPKDMIALSNPYHSLVNNAFLLHGYYNYNHLILGPAKGNKSTFFIGVPGNFYKQEVNAARMFGFEYFENGGDKVEVGDFGYYMKKVKL